MSGLRGNPELLCIERIFFDCPMLTFEFVKQERVYSQGSSIQKDQPEGHLQSCVIKPTWQSMQHVL